MTQSKKHRQHRSTVHFFFIFDGAGVDGVHREGRRPEAGDSKWEMARCCYMKGFYMFFDMAASSHSPLRISSSGGRTTCSYCPTKVPGQNYSTRSL